MADTHTGTCFCGAVEVEVSGRRIRRDAGGVAIAAPRAVLIAVPSPHSPSKTGVNALLWERAAQSFNGKEWVRGRGLPRVRDPSPNRVR